MADVNNAPWLTFVGLGESGTSGLTAASQTALEQASTVFGARRHLDLLPDINADVIEWPLPFSDGIPLLLAKRGQRVVMLVSGDPFWFGAGTSVSNHLQPNEWTAIPSQSTFSLAASALGWPLERATCLGLHATPLNRIRPYLQPCQKLIVLLRDGAAVRELAGLIASLGFAESTLHLLEALGGERQRIRVFSAGEQPPDDINHPVAVAIDVAGSGPAMPRTPGLPDSFFEHDGQITKQTVRALTLSALSPMPGELLWDIGTGSGSVAIEWLLAHPQNRAISFEASTDRAATARRNALNLGVDWLDIVEGRAPDVLGDQPLPDAVFIGGGLTEPLLETLWQRLPEGTRLVANAVTLESEALLVQWQGNKGGELQRVALSSAGAIGSRRGWKAQYPIVQWRVTL